MKKYQKQMRYFMIAAFCAIGLLLVGCKAKIKKHNTALATSAVVNAMMVTNPMGALFGNNAEPEGTDSADTVQTATALSGCPTIHFNWDLTQSAFYQNITITYAPTCLVDGIAMSGTMTGYWGLKHDEEDWFKVYIESELTVDNMTMEGLTNDGYIHQILYFDFGDSLAKLDGNMTTTHADGRTRSIAYDALTAQVYVKDFMAQLIGGSSTLTVPSLVINGSAEFTDEDGNTYTMDFDNVIQQFTCGFPTSGTLHIVNTEEDFDAVIDYGDGTCDTLITLTLAGEDPQEIDIREFLNKRQYRF